MSQNSNFSQLPHPTMPVNSESSHSNYPASPGPHMPLNGPDGISMLTQAASLVDAQTSQHGPPGTNLDGFQVVHTRRKRAHTISSTGSNESTGTLKSFRGTNTQNRYDPLAGLNDDDEDMDSAKNQGEKIPPIYITLGQENVQVNTLIQSFKNITEDFQIRNMKDKIKIIVQSSDDFRNFVNFLDNKHVEYFTYQLPVDKNLDVVIRHVPIDFSIDEVKAELVKLGYSVQRVHRLQNRSKQAIPVVQAALLKNSSISKEIFGLRFLFNCSIVVEPKRRSYTMLQCTNCQQYGHTKTYCKIKPRCVKCSGSHSTKDCMKNYDDPCVCVNCGKNHTANFRGCSYYQELKQRFGPKPVQPNTRPAHRRRIHNPPPPDPSTFPPLRSPAPTSNQQSMALDHAYSQSLPQTSSLSAPHSSQYVPHSSQPDSFPSQPPTPSPILKNHPRARQSASTSILPKPSTNESSSSNVWDSISDSIVSFLKPLVQSIIVKFKPFLIKVIAELLHGF